MKVIHDSILPGILNSTHVPIGDGKFKAASTFRYLDDAIGEAGGYVDLTNACLTAEWKGFRQL